MLVCYTFYSNILAPLHYDTRFDWNMLDNVTILSDLSIYIVSREDLWIEIWRFGGITKMDLGRPELLFFLEASVGEAGERGANVVATAVESEVQQVGLVVK